MSVGLVICNSFVFLVFVFVRYYFGMIVMSERVGTGNVVLYARFECLCAF